MRSIFRGKKATNLIQLHTKHTPNIHVDDESSGAISLESFKATVKVNIANITTLHTFNNILLK